MSEPTPGTQPQYGPPPAYSPPPAYGTPPAPLAAPGPIPAPAPIPAPGPEKKSSGGKKVLSIVGAILLFAIIVVVKVGAANWVSGLFGGDTYKVGACLDTDINSMGETEQSVNANVVDCSNAKAHSKITAVINNAHNTQAETVCPSDFEASIEVTENNGTKLLCLVSK